MHLFQVSIYKINLKAYMIINMDYQKYPMFIREYTYVTAYSKNGGLCTLAKLILNINQFVKPYNDL